jgi:hypothetical protein
MSTKLPNTTDKSIQDLYSENPNLVTIQKAAQALKVSKDTLRRWESKGKITSIRTTSGYRLYDLKTLSKTIKSKPQSESVKPQFNPKSPIMLPVTSQTPLVPTKEDHHSFYEFTNLNPEIVKLPSQNTQTPIMPVKRVNDYSGFSRIRKDSKTASINNLTPFKIYSVVALMIVFLSSLLAISSPYIPVINQTQPVKYISGLIQKGNKAIKPSQEIALTQSKPEVLAASSIAKEGKFLQLNLDTNVVGNLAVDGEAVFTENITAPNILYSLVAGNNISITGDAQNPTISSTVPLPGDATNTTKGIASFSSTFFTVTDGAVTIADGSITGDQIDDGTVTNTNLANSSITINAGSGLSGGGTVSLGGSITLTATGGGSSVSGVSTITGTANQVIASASTGDITLSLPQSIATTSSPEFANLDLSDLDANGVVFTTGAGLLDTVTTASTGECLLSNGAGAPTWGSCFSGSTSFTLAGDSGPNQSISSGDTLTINGDSNISTLGVDTDHFSITLASALTGINSIDTIAVSSTALTFAGAGTISSTTSSAITLDSGTTGTVNVGTGNNSKTINLGTGTAGNIINIATDNTVADTLNIASALDTTVLNGAIRIAALTTNGPLYTSGGNGTLNSEAQLAVSRGGTGQDFSSTAQGSLPYFSATGTFSALAPSTAGYVLTTQGAGANPTWTDAGSLTLRWNTIDDPNGNQTLAMADYTTNWNWATADNETAFSATANALTSGTLFNLSSTSTAGADSGNSFLLDLSRSGTNSNASHTAYGVRSQVTNTGTTSTNIAGYFSASGASTNYALYAPVGNMYLADALGIGTGSVGTYKVDFGTGAYSRTLNVTNTSASGTAYGAYINKSGAATTGVGLYVTSSGATNNYAAIFDAGRVGIGDTTPDSLFDFEGAISGTPSSTGAWLNYTGSTFTDSATSGSGTATTFAANAFGQPTLAATNSNVTTTNAATVYIANAPATGSNQTITAPLALLVDSGAARFDGHVGIGSGYNNAAVSSTSVLGISEAYTGSSSFRHVNLFGSHAPASDNSNTQYAFASVLDLHSSATASLTGTVTAGLFQITNSNATQSIGTAFGSWIGTATSSGGAITNNYGLFIDDQTVGSSDYGLRIDAADTQTLWVGGGANGTTASAGIAFGSSRDTNLYRSASDTLKTDDAFNVNGNLNITSAGAISAATGITSSGTITFSGLSADSGVYTTTGGQLTTTPPSSGTLGYWSRTGSTLSPANSGDAITTSGNISTTGSGTISSAGLLSGTAGLTITGATASLNASSNFNTNINTGTSTGAISIGNSSAGAIALSTGSTFGVTTTTGSQTFTSANLTGTTTSSSYVFNASSLTSGTALYITSSATSGKTVDINASQTSGTVFNLAYGSAKTISGDLTGLSVDLNSGNVDATNQNITGVNFKIPTVTDTHTSGTKTLTGMLVNFGSGAGINQNGAGGTLEYVAGDFYMPALTQTAGTLNAYGTRVTTPATITTGGTAYGNYVSATGVGAGTLSGLGISSITGGAGTEYALNIGSGWDAVLRVGSTTVINGSGVTVEAGGGTGQSTYSTGDILYASGANTLAKRTIGNSNEVLTVVGGVPTWATISGASCSNCLVNDPTSDQTIAPTGQGTTGLTVRQTSTASPTDDIFQITSSDGATKYFYVDKDGNVSTSGTSGQTLTLTPLTDTTALTLVGTNVTSQPLQYVNSKNSSATSGIINMAYGVAQTLTGSVIGIRTDLSTNVTATNQSVTGYQITLPGATNTSGTQAYKGIVISGGSINENGGTATTFTGADITIPALTQTSGTLTAYGANITTPSSITTGGSAYGVNIAATGVGAGSLYGVNVSDISAGAGTEVGMQIGSGWDTNMLFNDTSTRVAVADGGTITILDTAGNSLCTITDNGSVGDLECTGSIGGSGTVGFWSRDAGTGIVSPSNANDVVAISSNKTSTPLLNLTSTGATSNAFTLTGNSITTGNLASLTGTGFTTGEILDITGTWAPSDGSTNEAIDINITHTPTSLADNFTGLSLQVGDGSALNNTVYGGLVNVNSTGNAAKTMYGFQSGVQSSSTTADTLTSLHAWGSITGAITTGTRSIYGIASPIASTAASTGGTQRLFGGYFSPSSTLSNPGATDTATNNIYGVYTSTTLTLASDCTTNCTSNQYGLYVDNGSSDTDGTSAKYGIYINTQSGADTNYALYSAASANSYFAGNLGIGTSTPASPLEISSTLTADNSRALRVTGTFSSAQSLESGATILANATHTTGTMTELRGIRASAQYSGTSASSPAITTFLSGMFENIISGASPTGTITNGYGIAIPGINNTATGSPSITVTNQKGLQVSNQANGNGSNGLTITSAAGLVLENTTGATNNTNLLIGTTTIPSGTFSIYNSSTAANYFAGNVGIGTTAAGGALDISRTYSANQAYGFRNQVTHDTAVSGNYGAIFNTYYSHTTGTTTEGAGLFSQAMYQGTSATSPAMTSIFGAQFRTGIRGTDPSGTITGGNALRISSISNQATGSPSVTFTNQIGIRIDNQGSGTGSGGLTITSAAGLAIADTSADTNATNLLIGTTTIPSGTFSIYNSSTAANYFAGNVGIGTTTPAYPLQISATVNPSSDTRYGINNTVTSDTAFASGALYGTLARAATSATTSTSAWVAGANLNGRNTGAGTLTTAIGAYTGVDNTSTGTITTAYGLRAYASNTNASGTISTLYNISVDNPSNSGTLTTNYGLFVADQTAGSSDYGLTIAGADTQVLWLSSGADNTDAANGIAFGSSRDTNLYRSAANTLKTDDAFNVNGNFNVTAAGVISGATGLTSSGTINFSGLSASSGVYTDGSKNLTSTPPSSGTVGYWSRSGTTISPATANDIVSLATTNTTGADLAITNTGVYTGTGIFNLTANSATTGNLLSLTATGMTSGEVLNIDSTYSPADGSNNEAIDINLTNSPTVSANTLRGIDLTVNDSTALDNVIYGYRTTLTMTGNAAKIGRAVEGNVTSSSTTADALNAGYFTTTATGNAARNNNIALTGLANSSSTTADNLIGVQGSTSATGILTSGTRNNYGLVSQPASTAASTGGTNNTFGVYLNPSSTLSNPGVSDTATNNVYGAVITTVATIAADCTTNCTTNQYGILINDGTSSTNGTSTKYGLYLAAQTGADNNYGAYFGSNVGIGDNSPAAMLTVGSSDAFQVNSSGAIAAATGITSSGTINFSGLSASSGVYTDGSKNLTSTPPTSGTIGYWSRSSTTISPATANDVVSISSNDTSNAVLALTSTGAASSPFTMTANSVTSGTALSLSTTGMTTGEALDITGTWAPSDGSTNEAIDINITHSPTSVADTFDGIDLSITDNTSLANTVFGIDAYTVLSGNAAKTSYGLSGSVTSSSTTADTLRGVAGWTTSTGATTTGTRNSMGVYGRPVSTAASTGGTLNMYGGYFDSSSTLSNPGASDTSTNNIYGVYTRTTATLAADCTTNCTTNQYGLYVDNGTSDTDGTSAKYGIYINTQSGADTNYALYSAASANSYFAGNLGIGTTPSGAYRAQVSRSITSSDNSFDGNLSASASVSSVTDGYTYVGFNNYLATSHSSNAATLRGIDAKTYFSSQMASEATVGVNTAYTIHAEKGITGSSPTGTISNAFGLYSTFYSSATGTPAVTVSNNYGLYITNQGTPSGSPSGISVGNAIGLYVAAQSGATGTNYAAVFAGGNVGIGDTSPASALTVGSGDLFQVNSSGAIAAVTGYTQASGAFAFSGGGNFSIDSAAFDVNTSGAISGVTTLTQSGLHTINQGSAVRSIDINDTAASPSTPVIDVNRTNNTGTPAITNAALYINDHSTNYLLGFETGTTDLLTFTGAGQLSLPVSGSGAGLVLGGDTNLYRSAADTLRTDDAFNVGGNLNVTAAGVISGATGLTSSGTINFSGLSASSGVYTDSSKNLTSTPPSSGTIGYWSRSGTALSPATAGDVVLLDNNTAYQMKDTGGVARSLVSLNSSDMQTFGIVGYNATYNGYSIDITSALPSGQTTSSAFDIKSSSDLGSSDELVQFGDSAGDFLTILGGGNVGIGDTSPDAALEIVNTTTPQLRIGYDDTTNYFTGAVSSAGAVTFNTNGSGPQFNFSDRVDVAAYLSLDNGDFAGSRGLRFRDASDTGSTLTGGGLYQANNDTVYLQAGDSNNIIMRNGSGADQVILTASSLNLDASGLDLLFPNEESISNDTNGVINFLMNNTTSALQIGSTGITSIGNVAHSIVDSSGALNIDSNSTGAINIGTGANAKTITVGNNTGATALAFTSGTGSQTFTSSVATTSTTSSAFVFTANSLTSGTGAYVSSSSITTGKLFQLSTGSANTLSSGTLADIRTTSTALTGSTGTGSLLNLDWSPGSSTTATGDLFSLNIGSNGSTTGKLFNILDSSSSIFSVSETSFTTSLPSNFTAAGDTSIAYDLNFTNPTASYIESIAPLYLVAGETFNSSNLNLQTYNFGSVVVDSALTTGTGTKYNFQSTLSDATANANFLYGVYSTVNNSSNTSSGTHSIYGGYFSATSKTTGTTTAIGVYGTASGGDNNFPFYSGVAFPTANTAGLCWDNSGESAIYDCNGTPTDLAENYGTSDSSIEAGDVVAFTGEAQEVLDPREGKVTTKAFVKKSNSQYQNDLVGIVSTNPNQTYGEDGLFSLAENPRPVSLTGRVPVKVSTENGPISAGDYLTSSSTPGVAMKSTQPGVTIGRALSGYNGNGVGKVIVYVKTGFADPNEALANLLIGNNGQLLGSELNLQKITVATTGTFGGLVSADDYKLNADNISRVGVLASLPVDQQNRASVTDALNLLAQAQNSQESRITDLQSKEASTAAALADAKVLGELALNQTLSLQDSVASTSASIASLSSQIDSLLSGLGLGESSDASEASDSGDLADQLTPPTIMFASDSATLDNLTVNSQATISGQLKAYEGIFQNSLKSLGDTFLGRTNIAGDLSVDGTFSVSEGSKVNALPTLYFQTSALAEAVDFFNGLITINKDGALAAKEVVAEQFSVKADSSAGQMIIQAGETEIPVLNQLVDTDSIIILTSETAGAPALAVSDKVESTGFVVKLGAAHTEDIKVSYLIVGQK